MPLPECAEGRAYQLSHQVTGDTEPWSAEADQSCISFYAGEIFTLDIINLSDKSGKPPEKPQEIFYPYSIWNYFMAQRKIKTKELKSQSKCAVNACAHECVCVCSCVFLCVHVTDCVLVCTGVHAHVCPLWPEEDIGHSALPTTFCLST